MIQRIQTVFLFLAAAVLSCQFAFPYLTVQTGGGTEPLPSTVSDGILNPLDNIGLLGLTILGIICSLIAVFLFRNRPLQSRIAGGAGVASVMLAVLSAWVLYQTTQQVHSYIVHFGFGLALPVFALGLQFMAQRAIRKDEEKVRSMDRLR